MFESEKDSIEITVIIADSFPFRPVFKCATMVHELDVLAPFDFKTNPSWRNIYYKVLLVSTEVTYFACGLLFVPVAEEWVWDYAISVTILHVAITSTVMLEFPLTSHWWAALDGHPEILLHRILRLLLHRCDACCLCGTGLISMICGGQTLAYCLFKDNFIYPDLDNF
ncbi:putative transmembrane protein 244 isoform X1 [Saimiri boliviensis]|uniref:putative transmembrane protein 244 isoform X1 n=1 Tax=Saimiri boliviensis TaxID=27679 RepID=UPI003D77B4F4